MKTRDDPARVPRSEIVGWSLYDVADSGFTTVIITALYPLYFGSIVVGDPRRADFLWGLAASLSEVTVALLAPVLGAIADFSASRKRFLAGCALVIVVFTASLYLVGPGMAWTGLVLFVCANVGFAGGGVFIDSFLPGISDASNAGRISGVKWAMGYGGGLLCLALCTPLAGNIVENPTAAQLAGARLIPLVVAAWYAAWVIPTLVLLRERGQANALPAGSSYLAVGFGELRRTLAQVRRYRELFKLLLAFLLYNDGIVTVIYFSARLAKETFGLSSSEIAVLFLATNVVAAGGALLFGWLADRMGQKRAITLSLCVWMGALGIAWFAESREAFYAVSALAGIGMGSCQSVTRSLVSLFTPEQNAAEFYGFLGIAGKATAFAGPLVFGTVSGLTGSQRPALLAIGFFFAAGMLVLQTVDERRGMEASRIPI